jgi:hypothetical protein
MTKEPTFIPTQVFRETPNVSFYDATISNTNGCDVVRHGPNGMSPPYKDGHTQWYVHYHQVDRNLCVYGSRIFYLVNLDWKEPYHMIYLTPDCGSLYIPIGCYHRSVSGEEGSVLINQSTRGKQFSFETEFIPVMNDEIAKVIQNPPVIWKGGRREC